MKSTVLILILMSCFNLNAQQWPDPNLLKIDSGRPFVKAMDELKRKLPTLVKVAKPNSSMASQYYFDCKYTDDSIKKIVTGSFCGSNENICTTTATCQKWVASGSVSVDGGPSQVTELSKVSTQTLRLICKSSLCETSKTANDCASDATFNFLKAANSADEYKSNVKKVFPESKSVR